MNPTGVHLESQEEIIISTEIHPEMIISMDFFSKLNYFSSNTEIHVPLQKGKKNQEGGGWNERKSHRPTSNVLV